MEQFSIKKKISLIASSLFLCIILLEVGFRLTGFIILSLRERESKIAIRGVDVYKIICLGGSTTAMDGEPGGAKYSYPAQLERILNQKDIGIKFKVINEGVCSANSSFILSRLKENLDKYKPNMVITMIGLNDDFFNPVPYDESLKTKLKMFFTGLRMYKLAKVLKMNIMNRFAGISVRGAGKTGKKSLAYDRNFLEVKALEDSAMVLHSMGKAKQAEKLIQKALKIGPGKAILYIDLGEVYLSQKKFKKAEEAFMEAIAREPTNAFYISKLGYYYYTQERYKEAAEIYEDAIRVDPTFRDAYRDLAHCYKVQRNFKKLEELCVRIERLSLKRAYLYSILATGYSELGQADKAEKYYKKANDLRLQYYKPVTRHNYSKLKEFVIKKGIKLVCVQYPMRSVKPLRKLFDSTKGIIFVDNEEVFKSALKHGRYEDYFIDYCGGEFGHATSKGNGLLAKNIADVISREYFRVKGKL